MEAWNNSVASKRYNVSNTSNYLFFKYNEVIGGVRERVLSKAPNALDKVQFEEMIKRVCLLLGITMEDYKFKNKVMFLQK